MDSGLPVVYLIIGFLIAWHLEVPFLFPFLFVLLIWPLVFMAWAVTYILEWVFDPDEPEDSEDDYNK